jgi:streptogrisin D
MTVFAAHDLAENRVVFGVENAAAMRGVQTALSRLGVPASGYTLRVTDPIRFASTTLRTEHRPTKGGIQINFGNYVCTLGFNIDHAGGRSFVTNSHCTNQQGTTGSTAYYQPVASTSPTPIAVEAHDPSYTRLPGCSRGKTCRYSDAARALYEASTSSSPGVIAKTDGVNDGSLAVAGSFTITSQDDRSTSFSGTLHKVGRTTGWSSGNVTSTCATVNVSGSNIQLLCQTIVENPAAVIVQGGDSGSPVFRITRDDNVQLAGILWGGSSSGSLFVFSPLKQIQDELGAMIATSDGAGGGGGDGGGDGGGGGGEDPAPCVPRGPSGNNCK